MVSRGLFDGSREDAVEFVADYNGSQEDVGHLLDLWSGLEPICAEMRRIAHTPAPIMVASATISARRRAAAHTESYVRSWLKCARTLRGPVR